MRTRPVIRRFEAPDSAATRRVFESAIRGTAANFYAPEQIDAWCPPHHDPVAWCQARERAWVVVAEVGGDVVAFSDLTEDGVVDMLFVHPDAGGAGVARRLVDAVLDEARRRNMRAVTTQASRAARPVFEHLGFEVLRENPDNMIRGVAVPNTTMRRRLL